MMESRITEYDQAGYLRERTGAILPNVSPSNVFPTRDGKLMLIADSQDTVFKRLAAANGPAGTRRRRAVCDPRRVLQAHAPA